MAVCRWRRPPCSSTWAWCSTAASPWGDPRWRRGRRWRATRPRRLRADAQRWGWRLLLLYQSLVDSTLSYCAAVGPLHGLHRGAAAGGRRLVAVCCEASRPHTVVKVPLQHRLPHRCQPHRQSHPINRLLAPPAPLLWAGYPLPINFRGAGHQAPATFRDPCRPAIPRRSGSPPPARSAGFALDSS